MRSTSISRWKADASRLSSFSSSASETSGALDSDFEDEAWADMVQEQATGRKYLQECGSQEQTWIEHQLAALARSNIIVGISSSILFKTNY